MTASRFRAAPPVPGLSATTAALVERSLQKRSVADTVDYLAAIIEAPPGYAAIDAVRRSMDKRKMKRATARVHAVRHERPITDVDPFRREAPIGCDRLRDRMLELFARAASAQRCSVEQAARGLLNPPRPIEGVR